MCAMQGTGGKMSAFLMPDIIAHRGASGEAPENTLSSFRLAWEQGAEGIEGDFRLTSDGHIVCVHDARTGRTASVDIEVGTATLSELRKLDVGSWKGDRWAGERMALLEEVLSVLPEGKKAYLEIKSGPEIVPAFLKILGSIAGDPGRITVISFHDEVLRLIKDKNPMLQAFLLQSFKMSVMRKASTPSLESVLERILDIKADGLGANWGQHLSSRFVDSVLGKDLSLNVWTVDDEKDARCLRDLGVTSISTNRPGCLRDGLCV